MSKIYKLNKEAFVLEQNFSSTSIVFDRIVLCRENTSNVHILIGYILIINSIVAH
jgi:hypothetical protein